MDDQHSHKHFGSDQGPIFDGVMFVESTTAARMRP